MFMPYYSTVSRKVFFRNQFAFQKGKCAICGKEGKLVIDHDHGSGYMRGLLCGVHNSGIGMLGDDPALLRKAADYLEAHAKKELDYASNRELIQKLLNDSGYPSDRARAREFASLTGSSLFGAVSAIQRARKKLKKAQMHTESVNQL